MPFYLHVDAPVGVAEHRGDLQHSFFLPIVILESWSRKNLSHLDLVSGVVFAQEWPNPISNFK